MQKKKVKTMPELPFLFIPSHKKTEYKAMKKTYLPPKQYQRKCQIIQQIENPHTALTTKKCKSN